jgi:hypothetical protein
VPFEYSHSSLFLKCSLVLGSLASKFTAVSNLILVGPISQLGTLSLPTDMRALDQKYVIRLLRSEVNRAGGQKEWAKKNGVAPSMISMVLTGDRPPSKRIISALKLRRVVVFERVR